MSRSPQSEERSSRIFSRNHAASFSSVTTPTDSYPPGPPSTTSQRDVPPRSTPALPPLATLTGQVEPAQESGVSGSPTPWRALGVRNILNPASEAQPTHTQPVPPSPQNSAHGPSVSHPLPNTSPHVRKRGDPHSPVAETQAQGNARPGRRILTPRSPALRAASMGATRSPSVGAGLIHRVPLPSGDGRAYTAEPGEGRDAAVPPLPPLSAATRGSLPGAPSREGMSSLMRPAPGGMPMPPANPVSQQQQQQQQDMRPDLSRPPYASGEAGSSGFLQGQGQMLQHPAHAASESQTNFMSTAPGSVQSGLRYGQTEYQLTFETQQGPMVVPVNVDYQQASRLADEKRKRNAGASARFRARRKEKEREANQTIAGLQQELQELQEQRDFYLQERNFFRDLLARNKPGPLPARAVSPQPRRSHGGGNVMAESGSSVDYGRQEPDLSGPPRQRTSDYQQSLTSQSPSTSYNPAPFPPPPQGPPMTLPAPPPSTSYSDSRIGPPGPPHPTSRPPPFDPLRRNVLDRDWTSGR